MQVGSLFSGIGGLDLGLERAGMKVVWQVENNKYCLAVLAKHWPDVRRYGDIKEVAVGELGGVDLICGGFPCQPVSIAGGANRKGVEDVRWLWPEFARVVAGVRPQYVLLENVPGLRYKGGPMGEVLGDLARLGYNAEWESIPAAAVGAPHLRYRVFILATSNANCNGESTFSFHAKTPRVSDVVADSNRYGQHPNSITKKESDISNKNRNLEEKIEGRTFLQYVVGQPSYWQTESEVGRVVDGVPNRVDRIRCLGNAVVPQVAEWVGRQILECE